MKIACWLREKYVYVKMEDIVKMEINVLVQLDLVDFLVKQIFVTVILKDTISDLFAPASCLSRISRMESDYVDPIER